MSKRCVCGSFLAVAHSHTDGSPPRPKVEAKVEPKPEALPIETFRKIISTKSAEELRPLFETLHEEYVRLGEEQDRVGAKLSAIEHRRYAISREEEMKKETNPS